VYNIGSEGMDMHGWLEEKRYDGLSEHFKDYPSYIIAEIGSNWKNRDEPKNDLHGCLMSIDYAKACGADAVKFQFYNHEEMYGKKGSDEFALPGDYLPRLADFCKKMKIDFLCSAFSVKGLATVEKYVKKHKIASSKVGDPGVIKYIKGSSKDFIVSDGMFDIPELNNVIPMICAAAYPAQPTDYNLYKMHQYCGAPRGYGFSDHTQGFGLAEIMRAHGCQYFEKHVNFLGRRDTPDACVSIDSNQFGLYVKAIRNIEVGRPKVVKAKARKMWGDRYDGKLKRYVRPKK
jgi:sialic acid synthase SpsE